MKLLRFTNTQTPTVEFNAIRADGSFLKLTVFAGNNRVTDEDLATIQNHPNYNSLPELGRVEIIDAPKGADENFESLDKFSGNTISKLIEGELNVARLSRWLAGNNNPRIVEQLNEQIQWLERLG